MAISPAPNVNVPVTAQSEAQSQTAPAAAATDDSASTAAAPADAVTLSDAAKQALASQEADAPANGDTHAQAPQVAAFYSQAAIVMDTSGKYSQDDQLKAYVGLWNTMEAGFPAGLGSDAGQVFHDAMLNSSIGQLQQQLSNSFNTAGAAAFQMGNSNNAPAIAKAELGVVSGWSDFEKNVFFQTNVDEKLHAGGNHFGSIDNWISSLQAAAGSGDASAAPTQATVPIGLTDEQKSEVTAVIGSDKTPAATSPSATVASTPSIDTKTALAQGIAKLLSDAQDENAARDKSKNQDDDKRTAAAPSRPTLAELIAGMESPAPSPVFTASPKPDNGAGAQLNQSA